MAKQVDQDFFKSLILHCLDYVPVLPDKPMAEPDIKTLKAMKSTINFIRSDYYSWFVILISSIPSDGWKEEILKAQVSCINLKDKNEEFLLSCSFLVQQVHFVVMRSRCFRFIDVAASCLYEVYNEKYHGIFSNTDDWNAFERYCETTLQHKRMLFRQESTSDKTGQSSERKNISAFWNQTEATIVLYACSDMNKHLSSSVGEKIPFNGFYYPKYLTLRIIMIPNSSRIWEDVVINEIQAVLKETDVKSFTKNVNCPKLVIKFCFGCVLTKFYTEMEKSKFQNFKCHGRLDRTVNDSEIVSIGNSGRQTVVKKKYSSVVEIRSSITLPCKNKIISMIKVIKKVFMSGMIVINRMFTPWLIIPKVLKSEIYSLLKLFFYIICLVFGWDPCAWTNLDYIEEYSNPLMLGDNNSANSPTLDHIEESASTIEDDSVTKSAPQNIEESASIPKDDCIEDSLTLEFIEESSSTEEDGGSISNPSTLYNIESASIPEGDPIANPSTLANTVKEYSTSDHSTEDEEILQLLNLSTEEHPSMEEIGSLSAQEVSTGNRPDSGVESMEPSGSGDKVNGLRVSNNLLEPQLIENILNDIQTILNWIQGISLINDTFNTEDVNCSLGQICPFCETKCYEILLNSFDDHKRVLKTIVLKEEKNFKFEPLPLYDGFHNV